jgi:PAS domain S-box-containing protein
MFMGGPYNTPQAARIIRYAGLLLPIILSTFGYLYAFGVVTSKNYVDHTILTAIVSVWMVVAVWQFVAPSKTRAISMVRLTLYHLLSAAYLLFVTGISAPFVACWIILLIVSYLYLGYYAMLTSLGVFVATVFTDMLLWSGFSSSTIFYDLAVLVAVLLSGVILTSIHRAQAVDRTELQRSHEQEVLQRDRILTIVNNLADAFLSTDKNGIVRVYNAAAMDLLDTNDSFNGHHIDTILPLFDQSDDPVEPSVLFKDVTTVTMRDDLWFKFDDGERIRLEVTVSPIRRTFRKSLSGQDGSIFIIRDVTKAKSLEEERDEFISVVSHELRTPITVVEGSLSNVEFMLEKEGMSKEKMIESVKAAREQTMYLAKMVNDLSALSRAERGVADAHEVIDVQDLIRSMFDRYSQEAHDKSLTLDIDVGARVGSIEVSRLYIEELLQNFITNAIKYTKEGGVTISAKRKGSDVVFAVKDTGIGISKTDQAKVFEKFYRSEDYRTRETGGTGLGLYVVSKLARKLDTNIELTSRLNYGSTFSFTIPARIKSK